MRLCIVQLRVAKRDVWRLQDLKSLAAVSSDWRTAVTTAPASVWREAARNDLPPSHPVLSTPLESLQVSIPRSM